MDANLALQITTCANILGTLYSHDPKDEVMQEFLGGFADPGLATEWPLGDAAEVTAAFLLLARGAAAPLDELRTEYKRQFVGPGHFEAPAWGSVYLDSDEVVFGLSNLELEQWRRRNGIAQESKEGVREPSDHIGKMLILLAWLASEKPELVEEYLAEHLMPWAPRYLELFEASAMQPFYVGLAQLTRTTLTSMVGKLDVAVSKKQLFH